MPMARWFVVVGCAFALALWLSSPGRACIWDSDTLRQERSRVPSTLELLTGKFARHSPGYYRWRLEDRQRQVGTAGPTPELLDDMAVCHDKLGNQDAAIALMQESEKKFPGRYETAANLGTFYFHAKRYEEGIPWIERAIRINPQAHFGREVYQLKLVQYLKPRLVDGQVRLPLAEIDTYRGIVPGGFRGFILNGVSSEDQSVETQRAIQGILGMMRFGKHDSPVLLEALGDLLSDEGYVRNGNQQLAVRAFLRASQVTRESHPEASAAYRRRAEAAISNQLGGTGQNGQLLLADLEPQFDRELEEAQKWYAELEQDETAWIALGKDPEAAYNDKYARVENQGLDDRMGGYRSFVWQIVIWGVGAAAALAWLLRRTALQRARGTAADEA